MAKPAEPSGISELDATSAAQRVSLNAHTMLVGAARAEGRVIGTSTGLSGPRDYVNYSLGELS